MAWASSRGGVSGTRLAARREEGLLARCSARASPAVPGAGTAGGLRALLVSPAHVG